MKGFDFQARIGIFLFLLPSITFSFFGDSTVGEVISEKAFIRTKPNENSPKRGIALKGARIKIIGRIRNKTTNSVWYKTEKEFGYISAEDIKVKQGLPSLPPGPTIPSNSVLPYKYARARFKKTPIYNHPIDLTPFSDPPFLLKGFGFALRKRYKIKNRIFFQTNKGYYIRAAHIRRFNPSKLNGITFDHPPIYPLGFTLIKKRIYSSYRPPRKVRQILKRYASFELLKKRRYKGKIWYRISKGWITSQGIKKVHIIPKPKGIKNEEKWIWVDLEEQTIAAYQGNRMVYASLVSTGKEPYLTPPGIYEIRSKFFTITMNDEGDEENPPYSQEDVPFTMFFHQDLALHGVYWHDRFGRQRSHGCINLSPWDSLWFFVWTPPSLPLGWQAIFSQKNERIKIFIVEKNKY
jgi:hypothetical protein